MQLDLIISITILSAFALTLLGFIIGRMSKQDNYTITEEKIRQLEKKRDSIFSQEASKPQDKEVNDIKAGIVYRPSVEELNKMNEPQVVKEAKEAVAETIRNTPPPER